MATVTDYPDFNTPIGDLLEGRDAEALTKRASELKEGDLIALAWNNVTARTEKLTQRDIMSIQEAFSNHSVRGTSKSGDLADPSGAGCCCTCTPACCCTAMAVIN